MLSNKYGINEGVRKLQICDHHSKINSGRYIQWMLNLGWGETFKKEAIFCGRVTPLKLPITKGNNIAVPPCP